MANLDYNTPISPQSVFYLACHPHSRTSSASPADINFIRHDQNRVSGLTVNAGRVTNTRFVKLLR